MNDSVLYESATPRVDGGLGAVGEVKFAQDVPDVRLDGLLAYEQTSANDLAQEEEDRLLAELSGARAHLKAVVEFAVNTGTR